MVSGPLMGKEVGVLPLCSTPGCRNATIHGTYSACERARATRPRDVDHDPPDEAHVTVLGRFGGKRPESDDDLPAAA